MSARPVWVGTSWKMTKTIPQAVAYADALAAHTWPSADVVRPFVVPPATALAAVAARLGASSPVLVGAQDAHWDDAGAWTGAVSVPQVRDAGARLVEIGHSERREWFGETDRTVNLKVRAARRHGLVPLVCVGEPADVQAAGGSRDFVLGQALAAFAGLDDLTGVLLAYEPVWAIGERGRPARPDEIAGTVATLADAFAPRGARVLYGGSVDQANAADLLDVPGVDGLFVGRAAWQVEGFLALVATAAAHPR